MGRYIYRIFMLIRSGYSTTITSVSYLWEITHYHQERKTLQWTTTRWTTTIEKPTTTCITGWTSTASFRAESLSTCPLVSCRFSPPEAALHGHLVATSCCLPSWVLSQVLAEYSTDSRLCLWRSIPDAFSGSVLSSLSAMFSKFGSESDVCVVSPILELSEKPSESIRPEDCCDRSMWHSESGGVAKIVRLFVRPCFGQWSRWLWNWVSVFSVFTSESRLFTCSPSTLFLITWSSPWCVDSGPWSLSSTQTIASLFCSIWTLCSEYNMSLSPMFSVEQGSSPSWGFWFLSTKGPRYECGEGGPWSVSCGGGPWSVCCEGGPWSVSGEDAILEDGLLEMNVSRHLSERK